MSEVMNVGVMNVGQSTISDNIQRIQTNTDHKDNSDTLLKIQITQAIQTHCGSFPIPTMLILSSLTRNNII